MQPTISVKSSDELSSSIEIHSTVACTDTKNCFCQDVSTDIPNYKWHEYFTDSEKNIDLSLSREKQEAVMLESSTENTTCREEATIRMQEDQTICMQEDHFGQNIDRSDDDYPYFQCLATIVHSVSEELLRSVLNGN